MTSCTYSSSWQERRGGKAAALLGGLREHAAGGICVAQGCAHPLHIPMVMTTLNRIRLEVTGFEDGHNYIPGGSLFILFFFRGKPRPVSLYILVSITVVSTFSVSTFFKVLLWNN